MPEEAGQEPLESKSVRIDRERALAKLRAFQLSEPEHYLRHWVRLAVLSGARNVGVKRLRKGVLLRFEGKPLPERALTDPFNVLFEDLGEDCHRCRLLVIGLLAALRLQPERISILCGSERGSIETVIRDSGLTWTRRSRALPSEVRIEVEWAGRFSLAPGRGGLENLKAACGLLPITFNKRELDPPLPRWASVWDPLPSGEFRGVFSVATGDIGSVINFYKDGVLIESSQEILDVAQCAAHIDCGDFSTDLNWSGVNHDAVRRRAVEHVEKAAGDLFRQRTSPVPHVSLLRKLSVWKAAFVAGLALLTLLLFLAGAAGPDAAGCFWMGIPAMGFLWLLPFAARSYRPPRRTGEIPRFVTRKAKRARTFHCVLAECSLFGLGILVTLVNTRPDDMAFSVMAVIMYLFSTGLFVWPYVEAVLRD